MNIVKPNFSYPFTNMFVVAPDNIATQHEEKTLKTKQNNINAKSNYGCSKVFRLDNGFYLQLVWFFLAKTLINKIS